MRQLFLVFCLCFIALTGHSQISGTTGVVKAATKAALDAITPTVTQGHAVVGLVTSGSLEPMLYIWDEVNSEWDGAGTALSVQDGTTIDLSYNAGVLTAEIDQQGAIANQTLQWDGTNWTPQNQIASEVGVADLGSLLDASDLEAALAELATQTQLLFSVIGVNENDTDLGAFSGGIITENSSVKSGMQELETAVETKITVYGTYAEDADAAAANPAIPLSKLYYRLSSVNKYGGIRNIIKLHD